MSDKFFPERPEIRPMVYAYSDDNPRYAGLLKVGYTEKAVEVRVAEQYPTLRPGKRPYRIVFAESAMKKDGGVFSDHDLHEVLEGMGYRRLKDDKGRKTEWFRCTESAVRAAWIQLRSGNSNLERRTAEFAMRDEQAEAVAKTLKYFESAAKDRRGKPPRFLWNAKMRFGKTFAAYQLAKKMEARRVLVLTFKPAVESAWEEDLNTHVDFEGWQFVSRTGLQYEDCRKGRPMGEPRGESVCRATADGADDLQGAGGHPADRAPRRKR